MAIVVRALERRDGSVGSEAGVSQPLPTSVKALTGFIVVMGLIILGIAAWRIGKWRRSKIRAASQSFIGRVPDATSVVHVDFAPTGKAAEAAAEKEETTVEPYKWRPVSRPPAAHSSNKAVKNGTKRFFGNMATKKPAPLVVVSHSPPPTYDEAATTPYPTIVLQPADAIRSSAAPLPVQMLKADPSSPLPSPARTKSIGPGSPLYKSMGSKLTANGLSHSAAKQLPRLMAVVCTFTPSLADELAISIGEPLVLIEEYEDEWCLVQRAGKSDAERGVVPRFCLQEAPTLPNRRASHGVCSPANA